MDLAVYSNTGCAAYYNTGNGIDFDIVPLPRIGDIFANHYTFGDFPDLLMGINPTMTLYKNIDGKQFQQLGTKEAAFTKAFVVSFDADADGIPDLFGPGTGDTVILYLVKDGLVLERQQLDIGSTPYWSTVLDANNDGALDVVVATSEGLRLLLNDGHGKLSVPILISPLGSGNIASGDFDGDHLSDLAIVGTGGLDILRNNGDGTFSRNSVRTGFTYGSGQSYGLTIADLDGGGSLDVAFTLGLQWRAGDSLYLVNELNDGSGQFQLAQVWRAAGPEAAYLNCGDLSGRGSLDIAMGYKDAERVMIFQNDTSVAPVGVIQNSPIAPGAAMLNSVYPDPANQLVTIYYSLEHLEQITLQLYGTDGTLMKDLFTGNGYPGIHTFWIDCAALPNGTYFVNLSAESNNITREFTLTH